MSSDEGERRKVRDEFADAVNMTSAQLKKWLATDESSTVGDSDGGESTGHRMGRRDPLER
jgi:Protein of unknown function (DUF3140)